MEIIKKIIKNIFYLLLNLGDAFCMSYIVYQLFGVVVFAAVFFAFTIVSFYFAEPLIEHAWDVYLTIYDELSRSVLHRLFAAPFLVAAIFYSIFLFRNNVLYLSGLLLHVGFGWASIYCCIVVLVISTSFFGLMLWAELSSRIFKLLSMGFPEFACKAILIVPAYFISEIFVSMLLRGSAGFAQVFLNPVMIASLVPVIEIVLLVFIAILVFDSLLGSFELAKAIFWDNKYHYSLADWFVFALILIRAWGHWSRNEVIS